MFLCSPEAFKTKNYLEPQYLWSPSAIMLRRKSYLVVSRQLLYIWRCVFFNTANFNLSMFCLVSLSQQFYMGGQCPLLTQINHFSLQTCFNGINMGEQVAVFTVKNCNIFRICWLLGLGRNAGLDFSLPSILKKFVSSLLRSFRIQKHLADSQENSVSIKCTVKKTFFIGMSSFNFIIMPCKICSLALLKNMSIVIP